MNLPNKLACKKYYCTHFIVNEQHFFSQLSEIKHLFIMDFVLVGCTQHLTSKLQAETTDPISLPHNHMQEL